jgi:hypothetical protein
VSEIDVTRPETFAEAADLCERAGLRGILTFEQARDADARRGHQPDWKRTVRHEAGHFGAYADRSVSFGCLVIYDDGSGALEAGPRPPSPIPSERMRTLEAGIAAELGGLVAESVILGSVEPWGGHLDIVRAFARADDDERLVREVLQQLTQTFEQHQEALVDVAIALRRERRVDRATCIQLVRNKGWLVEIEPRYEKTTPAEVRRRIALAEATMGQSRFSRLIDADRADAKALRARIEAEVDAEMAAEDEDL